MLPIKSKHTLAAAFATLLLSTAISACSNDNDVVDPTPQPSNGADQAYIAVNIYYGSTSSRATDGGFEDATENSTEYKVSTLNFYFYDSNGNYVTESQEGSFSQTKESTTSINIESEISSVVVLKGLAGKGYPKYMVVVANKPDGVTLTGKSISQLQTETIEWSTFSSNSNFPMINATYKVDTNSNSSSGDATPDYNPQGVVDCYFAVPIAVENFYESSETISNYIDCYIERIPVKVKLSYATNVGGTAINSGSSSDTGTSTGSGSGDTGAQANAAETPITSGTAFPLEISVDGATSTSEKYYAVLSSWGLNATTTASYVAKTIQPDVWSAATNPSLDWTWNDGATNHRSYWGTSTVYGTPTEPSTTINLDYLSYQELALSSEDATNAKGIEIGNASYCFENTNTAAKLTGHISDYCTSILVKGIFAEKKNDQYYPLTLYVFMGQNYTEENWEKAVMQGVNYYRKVTDSENSETIEQIKLTDLEKEEIARAKVKLKLTSTAKGYTWYSDAACTQEVDTTAINTDFATNRTAEIYTAGMMYYCIPIEHLGLTDSENKYSSPNYSPKEGDYGVVRNHFYDVEITSVKSIGHAVYNPSTDIIPSDDDNKTYRIGANIKVLAWKHIKQQASL